MKISEVDLYFSYKHLPPHLQAASAPFGEAAQAIVALAEAKERATAAMFEIRRSRQESSPLLWNKDSQLAAGWERLEKAESLLDCGDLEEALQALVESKDCYVRAEVHLAKLEAAQPKTEPAQEAEPVEEAKQ